MRENRVKIDEHIFSSIVSLLLLLLLFLREMYKRMSRANCEEKCYKFTVHFQMDPIQISECVKRKNMYVLQCNFYVVSALKFYSSCTLTNFTFYDQTCCFIRSRACSEHTVCPSGVRIFFRNVIIIFRVCLLPLLLLLT